MPRALIFDADGMVIEGERVSTRLASRFGASPEALKEFFEGDFQDCTVGKKDLKEVLKRRLADFRWPGTVDELLQYWFGNSYRVSSEVVAAVRRVRRKGIIALLATNQEKYRVSYMKNEMGLGKEFDAVFASCEIGFRKPAPEFFQKIADTFPKITKNEFLFFDDRPEQVAAAEKFGFRARLYTGAADLSVPDL